MCLALDQELGEAAYPPKNKTSMTVDGFTITLPSIKSHFKCTERVLDTTSQQTRAPGAAAYG